MKELINELNATPEAKTKLELFLINNNLDKQKQVELLKLIKEINT